MKRPAALSEKVTFDEGERYECLIRQFVEEQRAPRHDAESPYRIYGRIDQSLWAIVDPEDFEFFSQWKWSYASGPGGKFYIMRRSGNAMKIVDGFSMRMPGKQRSIYLHREVMARTGIVQPSPKHKLVDHRNGNSLDCRRSNLRWATVSQNNKNKFGSHASDNDMAAA
jgi:hypothetical protein